MWEGNTCGCSNEVRRQGDESDDVESDCSKNCAGDDGAGGSTNKGGGGVYMEVYRRKGKDSARRRDPMRDWGNLV